MELGKSIATLRIEKGINQKELGRLINKSDSAICNYEKDVHMPDVDTLCKLADTFNVSVDFLLQRTNFRYGMDCLNTVISKDFTLGELLNTAIQLDFGNKQRLIDYVNLLILHNNINRGKK